MSNLPSMTQEERLQSLERARARSAAMHADKTLKREWDDDEYWQELAQQRGVTLPAKHLPPERHLVRRYLRKIGVKEGEFKMWGAYPSIEAFAEFNPTTPLRALVGFVLEYAIERDDGRAALKSSLRRAA